MDRNLLVLTIMLFLFACSSNKYRNISEFNMQPTALKDDEPIKLYFAGVGEENNADLKYYNHLIAVSQTTGDTVNILNPMNHGMEDDDDEKVFSYFTLSSPVAKVLLLSRKELENIPPSVDSLKPTEINYTRVIHNPSYGHISRNQYPTVIGVIVAKRSPQ